MKDLEDSRFPWITSRIDLAGMLGAVAAFLATVLLSLLWGPLFIVGLVALIGVILATRTVDRTSPPDANAIVAPVDGVLTSISEGLPPAELRLPGGDYVRLRVASSPASPNSIHAPMAGEILSLIEEAGDSSVRFARQPDEAGLANAYFTIGSGSERVGVRVVTGGFGPRLDVTAEAGDPVRTGRNIGVRRLGGWCDIWLPADCELAVWTGMSLKGAETRLVHPGSGVRTRKSDESEAAPEEAEPFKMPVLDPEGEDDDTAAASPQGQSGEPDTATTEDDENEASESSEDDGIVKDASEQFARLRKQVESSKRDNED